MQTDKIKTIVAAGMMVVAGALLFLSSHKTPPKVDPRPHLALGQALAEEAIKLAGNGGRITLITWDLSTLKNPAAEEQVKGFHRTLRKANLTLVTTNVFKLDPLRLIRVPAGDFLDVIRKQSEGDVIASFLGPPLLTREQRAKLGDKKPRIVAVCSGGMPRQIDLKELFAQNLLQVAIINRPLPGPNPSSDDLREWFDSLYQVVTAANLSALPGVTNVIAQDKSP